MIKKDIGPWLNMTKLPKKDIIVLTRLRLGHTNLTHSHLMDRSPPPLCNCGSLLTVKHIFQDCTIHNNLKKEYEIDGLLSLSNCKTENQKNIIKFINELNFYHLI